ncbi:MAG: hypothetical protein AAB791_00125 [Patescibacteria group bacterium]
MESLKNILLETEIFDRKKKAKQPVNTREREIPFYDREDYWSQAG